MYSVVCWPPAEPRVVALAFDELAALGVPLEMREDEHFLVSRADFRAWADQIYTDYEAVAIEIGMFKK